MEGSYPMHPSQAMQSPFFYYNPDPQGENARQHGHFTPHPSGQSTFQPQATVYFQRPSSANSAHPVPSDRIRKPDVDSSCISPANPQDSPFLRPIDTDYSYAPATPPLSSTGSNMSSPPSVCDFMPTPINGCFPGEGIEGVKQGCEGEVFSELLSAGIEWRSASPPMTPVFIQPRSASQGSYLLSATSCPSLSPSPSPIPRSPFVEAENNFCNPRDLTVSASESVHFPDSLPWRRGAQGSPLFELDCEDDFTGLASYQPAENTQFLGSKRQRTDLVAFTSEEEFVSDASFTDFEEELVHGLPLTPESDCCDDMHAASASKRRSAKKARSEYSDAESDYQGQASNADNANNSSSDENGSTPVAPTSRRGRKQSLTEDPSKTFVCTLCSRRFRRQEHLKRHYRSLHTHDKPFECTDCGDNLSQHQRTHGTGAVVMGVLDGSEMPHDMAQSGMFNPQNPASMGQLLYNAAESISSSSSDSYSDLEASAINKMRKRKRDE
ncbi:hypothetical protein SNOG_03780 [Parastagonospora nodorum SN15]|uniref:hypothetical protein n=1 Tax=Phaeosphaeria nodorum (strain SN15 / ATCC MYA-4574 / FGSC 10173) TaxID=321614 RepID=UPI000161B4BD|nr:hypothetical protein SNOG_03780 [Parastagonospora nodorum SN15]EAT88985.2 hypothetical protein SNOG_03780 [Parastagonospora nodorum SN15]